MSAKEEPPIRLDELAEGKLPKRVLDAISGMELTIEEVLEWSQSQPDFRITITEDELRSTGHKQFRMKRFVAIITSIVGVIWAVLQFVAPHVYQLIGR